VTASLADRVIDLGLATLQAEASHIYVCSAEPSTFANATSGATSLGYKSFGAGAIFGAPTAAADGNGRRVRYLNSPWGIGTCVTSGVASWWAVCSGTALLAHGVLPGNVSITAGEAIIIGAFDIAMRRG
jgi:hypothetical protein